MNPDDTQQNTNSQDPQVQDPSASGSSDSMFPSFLNNANTEDFDPSKMSTLDGQDQDDESAKTAVASPGSPEAGGAVVAESQSEAPEYSSEIQTSSESPEIESVESKDAVKPQVSSDIPDKPEVKEKPVEEEKESNAPKIFGYMVPETVMGDFKKIRTNKATGSTDSSKTWLYVLLDRLLKVHSKKG